MKRQALVLFAFVALPPLSACAGSGSAPPRQAEPRITDTTGETARVIRLDNQSTVGTYLFDAPLDRVWEALQGVYQDLELPVSRFEPGEGLIGNDGFRIRRIDGRRTSTYLDCGQGMTGPNADQFDVTMTLYTTVDAHERGTELVIDVSARGRPRDVAGNTVHGVSEGRLETLILERLQARLEGRQVRSSVARGG